MSDLIGTLGQCLLRMSIQKGLTSHCHTGVNPALSKPRSKPPMPAKNEANVRVGVLLQGLVSGLIMCGRGRKDVVVKV